MERLGGFRFSCYKRVGVTSFELAISLLTLSLLVLDVNSVEINGLI